MGERVWILDDGSKWVTSEVAKRLDCGISAARQRLLSSTDPEKVFRKRIAKANSKFKLDDGSEWTIPEVAKLLGVSKSTARWKLNRYTDPKMIFKPKQNYSEVMTDENEDSMFRIQAKTLANRMINDPHGHWALINKYV